MSREKLVALFIGIFLFGIVVGISIVAFSGNRQINFGGTNEGEVGVACTMEAKLCPDGSSVGRQGPKCEFAPCPGG